MAPQGGPEPSPLTTATLIGRLLKNRSLKPELCDELRTLPPPKRRFDLDRSGFPVAGCLLRKEVIQPQVPLRLPCYDFIPITSHTFGICFLAVSGMTSGTTGFHDVTGGVYKAWERIHGAVADAPLLAIPTSRRRVADDDLNWGWFLGICSTLRSCFPLCQPL